jgi:hypothetical protein
MNFLKLGNCVGGPVTLLAAMVANGCSGTPAPPPKAFVAGSVNAGTMAGVNDVGACGMSSPDQWNLGNAVSPEPTTKEDGSTQVGGSVHVSCRVQSSGSGYSIELSATLGGQYGGAMFLSGNVDASGNGTGLRGSFTTNMQTFLDQNCTVTPQYNGMDLPSYGKPASGRIWAHVDCQKAVVNGQFGQAPDGTAVPRACDATADFRFENCN